MGITIPVTKRNPCMTIGQETIYKEKLYPIIEQIDKIELGEEESEELEDLENRLEEIEGGQQVIMSAMESTEKDKQLKIEIDALVLEFNDLFATELIKESADVTPFFFVLNDKTTELPKSLRGGERRQPQTWYEKARPLVQELLKAQVIRRSNSNIYSHIHLAPKPGTEEMRLTIDYKAINSISKAAGNAMPLIDSYLEWVAHRRPKHFYKSNLVPSLFLFKTHPFSSPYLNLDEGEKV